MNRKKTISILIAVIILVCSNTAYACAPQHYSPVAIIDVLDDYFPVREVAGTYYATVDEEIHFDGGDSYDPPVTDYPLTYDWDFGDGPEGSTDVEPIHSFSATGTYTVTLTVTDDSSAWGDDDITIIIEGKRVHNETKDVWYSWIQHAVDNASANDVITVSEGTYYESVDFGGLAITVQSSDPDDWDVVDSTIIDANDYTHGVLFDSGEGANSVLKGFMVKNANTNGVLCSGTDPNISNCIIEGNGNAGVGCSSSGSPTITNNKIRGNDDYGVICGDSATPTIKNNLIYDNDYGVYSNSAGVAVITNNTIVYNTTAGIYKAGGTAPTNTNCILWDNGDDLYDCSATYSCIKDGDGGDGNISSNPAFVDADANDFHLGAISSCINSGDDGGDYSGQTDIDVQVRVMGGRVDMGADEFYQESGTDVIYVDTDATGDDDGRSWYHAYEYLQDALDAAGNGDEIWVAEGTYYPDEGTGYSNDDRTETFGLVANVAVYGGFAGDETSRSSRDPATNVAILSGDIDKDSTLDNDNSYNVVVGLADATLDGFTITMGYADHASTAQYQYGGGMFNYSCSPTVTNCIFDNNYAKFGGGMFNYESPPTVTGCSFTDNEAYYSGGGMYCYSSGAYFDITNCLFRDNEAANWHGGAIFFNISAQQIDVKNCTFSQNVAPNGYAGGLYSYASNTSIVNTVFWDNTDGSGDLDLAAVSSGTIGITYSDVTLSYYYSGTGSVDYSNCISVDPLFADEGNDDFHLKSPDGRWNGSSWITTDTVYSKCLVHAHPGYSYSNEPTPNGGKINMGAYGNTSEASKVNSDDLGSLNVSVWICDPYEEGPYNAQWRLSYEQDGTWHSPYNTGSFTLEGLVPATGYYVIFKDVSGYITPDPYGPFSISAGINPIGACYEVE